MEENLYHLPGKCGKVKVFSHLILADKKIIIDTFPESIADEFAENIEKLAGIKNIDCVIFTNASPNHAGALGKLLEINPDITVIATAAGLRNLKETANRDFKQRVAKDGDSVSVSEDCALDFIITPNIDWPDTMMVRYRNGIYTGKFFCAGDEDYFNRHFRRFSDFALTALYKIENSGADELFPSVGEEPELRADEYVKKYRDILAAEQIKKPVILYSSISGYTKKMAAAAAAVFEKKGMEYEFIDPEEENEDEITEKINNASMLCVGSSTVYRNAAPAVMSCLIKADAVMSAGKPCMVFGSYGWGGEALGILSGYAKLLKMKVFEKPFGVVLKPSDEDIKGFMEYTERFIESAV